MSPPQASDEAMKIIYEISALATERREAERARDEKIHEAHKLGASLRLIAAAAEVSHQTVKNILSRPVLWAYRQTDDRK